MARQQCRRKQWKLPKAFPHTLDIWQELQTRCSSPEEQAFLGWAPLFEMLNLKFYCAICLKVSLLGLKAHTSSIRHTGNPNTQMDGIRWGKRKSGLLITEGRLVSNTLTLMIFRGLRFRRWSFKMMMKFKSNLAGHRILPQL